MTSEFSTERDKRVECAICRTAVALTPKRRQLKSHADPRTGTVCEGSGSRRPATERRVQRGRVARAVLNKITFLVFTVLAGAVGILSWLGIGPSWSSEDRDSGQGGSGEQELVRQGIPRFDFWFSYPAGWAREDPENSDGNTYVDPQNTAVKVSFWGSYALGPNELQERRASAEAEGTVLDSREAGGRLRWQDGDITNYEDIPGWRVIVVSSSADGFGVTTVYQFLDAGDRIIGFQAVAPTPVYSSYLPLFREVIENIAVNKTGLS